MKLEIKQIHRLDIVYEPAFGMAQFVSSKFPSNRIAFVLKNSFSFLFFFIIRRVDSQSSKLLFRSRLHILRARTIAGDDDAVDGVDDDEVDETAHTSALECSRWSKLNGTNIESEMVPLWLHPGAGDGTGVI